MKKIHLIYMLFVLFTAVISSCGKNLNEITDTDMSLSISGGEVFEIQDNNITKNILVSCSSPAKEDIIVDLETSATNNEAELSTSQVIIKKGTKTVGANITFKIAAFPENSREKIILVRISTTNKNVLIEASSTEFAISGFIPLTLKAEINNTKFNTFEREAELKITLTLSKAINNDIIFALSLGDLSSNVFKELFTTLPEIKIAADNTSASTTLKIPIGTVGSLLLNIDSTNNDFIVETTSFTITFISERITIE